MSASLRRLPWHPLVGLAALLASIALLPLAVGAGELQPPPAVGCCDEPDETPPAPRNSRPQSAEIRPLFDQKDKAAALEAVQVALTEVGDGSTYVWYRHGGRLSGLVQPTQSFVDVLGRVCRHIVVTLNDASRQKRTEGIACRLSDGGWQLDG